MKLFNKYFWIISWYKFYYCYSFKILRDWIKRAWYGKECYGYTRDCLCSDCQNLRHELTAKQKVLLDEALKEFEDILRKLQSNYKQFEEHN